MRLSPEEIAFLDKIQRQNGTKKEVDPNIKLYDFQEVGVDWLVKTRRCILADEMGIGKTPQAIFAAERLNAQRVLIVCPNTLKHIWDRELEKFVGETNVEILTSPHHEIREAQIKSGCRFTIMNYEQIGERISRLVEEDNGHKLIVDKHNKKRLIEEGKIIVDEKHIPSLLAEDWDLIICDEAHKIKNHETASFKGLSRVILETRCPNLLFLTGTPVLNRPEEIWTLLHCIDPGTFDNFWRWKRDVAWSRQRFRMYTEPLILRREKKDVLSLPEKTYQYIDVDLEGQQRKTYDSMRDSMYAELPEINDPVEAICRLAQIIRLKQIAVSPDIINKYSLYIEGAKIDALLDVLEGAGDQKVVVFTQFTEVIKRLLAGNKLKGYNPVSLTGDHSNAQREKAIDTFQNDENCKVMLVSTLAGGVGITLTAGSVAVFMDLLWTPALNGQAADRLHRVGQKNAVTIIVLVATNTIESYILSVLADKEMMFNACIPPSDINKILGQGLMNGVL